MERFEDYDKEPVEVGVFLPRDEPALVYVRFTGDGVRHFDADGAERLAALLTACAKSIRQGKGNDHEKATA